jgi:hypothetical protein
MSTGFHTDIDIQNKINIKNYALTVLTPFRGHHIKWSAFHKITLTEIFISLVIVKPSPWSMTFRNKTVCTDIHK